MCGIAGWVCKRGGRPPEGLARRLLGRLAHRGPDDWGCAGFSAAGVVDRAEEVDRAPVALLHRRLSILDLTAAGHQPMSTADGRFHLVFNGEVYNYLELRDALVAAGRTFHTRTDTEVLLALLADGGPEALVRLTGMFAFALWDNVRRRLLLARDPFGIKPLYVHRSADRFCFASELKALLDFPGVGRRAHPGQLYDYLYGGQTDHARATLVDGIEQLLPGEWVEIDPEEPGRFEPVRYWRIDPQQRCRCSFEEAARRLRDLLLESVELHLRSDVPVGTALSGGIDSSAIICAMRRLAGPQAEIHSFSFIAAGSPLNEERWVDVAAAAAKAVVHKIRIEPEELLADLDPLIAAQDLPFGSTSIYAQHRVFRAARQAGVTVLLDGQGADEFFAGYPGFLSRRVAELALGGHFAAAWRLVRSAVAMRGVTVRSLLGTGLLDLFPSPMQHQIRRVVSRNAVGYWINDRWFRDRGVTTPPPFDPRLRRSLRAALLHAAETSSLPMLLRYEDRNSMAYSVESRVPFVTPAVGQFALSLPSEYLVGPDGTTKRVLRAALRGLVPDAILDRRDKIGFETPELSWMRALRPWIEQLLRSDSVRRIPALLPERILAQAEGVLSGRWTFNAHLWRWLNLARWAELRNIEFV